MAVAFATAAPVRAENKPLPTLRHLEFESVYTTTLTSSTEVASLNQPARQAGGAGTSRLGRATYYTTDREQAANVRKRSVVSINVVAVTNDGGLVVDASVEGQDRKAPPARIAILRDGRLVFDPNALVLEEELRVLPLLRRDAFDHELSAGAFWREPIDEKIAKGNVEYRVLRAEGPVAQLEIKRTVSVTGTNAYEETSRVVTDYDPKLLVPESATVELKVKRQVGAGANMLSNAEIRFQLLADTFRKNAR